MIGCRRGAPRSARCRGRAAPRRAPGRGCATGAPSAWASDPSQSRGDRRRGHRPAHDRQGIGDRRRPCRRPGSRDSRSPSGLANGSTATVGSGGKFRLGVLTIHRRGQAAHGRRTEAPPDAQILRGAPSPAGGRAIRPDCSAAEPRVARRAGPSIEQPARGLPNALRRRCDAEFVAQRLLEPDEGRDGLRRGRRARPIASIAVTAAVSSSGSAASKAQAQPPRSCECRRSPCACSASPSASCRRRSRQCARSVASHSSKTAAIPLRSDRKSAGRSPIRSAAAAAASPAANGGVRAGRTR